MTRSITAAQKLSWDYYKSDGALAQTNQIKYDCFFRMAHILYCSLILQWKNSVKNKCSQLGALEIDFSKLRISRFLVQILEIW